MSAEEFAREMKDLERFALPLSDPIAILERDTLIADLQQENNELRETIRASELLRGIQQLGYPCSMEDSCYKRFPAQLASIRDRTSEAQFSMASEPLVGVLLRTLAASKPGGRLLELGTGTGIATAWLLDGMDAASTLTSVDNDAAVQRIAEEFLGGDQRLTLVTSGGLEFLSSQDPESFDLVFADAMPGKYEDTSKALDIVRPGGFYIIDDMLPQANWPDGHASKIPTLIEQLAGTADFEILPLVWASGVVVAVKRASHLAWLTTQNVL